MLMRKEMPKLSASLEKIFGPPGCGKTTSLLSRLQDEIASGTPVERIAYLTFTVSAIEEAKARIADASRARWFRTIHSACCSMLGISKAQTLTPDDYAALYKETGYNISTYDLDAASDLDFVREHRDNAMKFAADLAASRCVSVADVLDELHYERISPEAVAEFDAAYRAFKGRAGKRDFMDMLLDYVLDPNVEPLPVDVVILDEAQDLSRLQWQAFFKLARNAKRIYVAGDDDQSIYSFLGADEFGFLDLECTRDTVLDHSYRCPAGVGKLAQSVISNVSRRKAKSVTWQDKPCEISVTSDAPTQLAWENIQARGETVMVLTRHRRQLYELASNLGTRGISHSIKGAAPNLGPYAEAVGTYLRATVKGEKVGRAATMKMLGEFRLKPAQAALARDRAVKTVDRKWLDAAIPPADHWTNTLAFGSAKRRQNLVRLRTLLNSHGLDVIGEQPKIDLSTMHASKGRQAGVVVILSDCYKSVQESMRRNPDNETRLSYVAITRSQREVVILKPRTSSFMTPLSEVQL